MTNNYLQSLQLTELAYGTEKTKARLNAKHTRTPVNEQRCPSIQQTGSTWHLTQWNIDAQTQGTWTYLQTLSDVSRTYAKLSFSPPTRKTHKNAVQEQSHLQVLDLHGSSECFSRHSLDLVFAEITADGQKGTEKDSEGVKSSVSTACSHRTAKGKTSDTQRSSAKLSLSQAFCRILIQPSLFIQLRHKWQLSHLPGSIYLFNLPVGGDSDLHFPHCFMLLPSF